MQKQGKDAAAKVEFYGYSDEIIEIHYFDSPQDEVYRSWKLPKSVAGELIKWWLKVIKPKKDVSFPINSRSGKCEFTMHTERCIEIKEIDSLGRGKMSGWSLPSEIVEELITWQKEEGCKK